VENVFGEEAKRKMLEKGNGRIDSMDAVRLMNSLQSKMGVDVPLQAIFSRPLHEIGQMVDAAVANPETFGAALKRAEEINWTEEMHLPASVVAPREPQPAGNAVLLTGCTGFLGV
jgi:acyl carrier protein